MHDVCACKQEVGTEDDPRRCRCLERPEGRARVCRACRRGEHVGPEGQRLKLLELRSA